MTRRYGDERRAADSAPVQLDAIGLTLLRIAAGGVMIAHGLRKIAEYDAWQATVAQLGMPLSDLAAPLAVAAELGGGILLVLGLITPLAGLMIAAVMATAIAFVHAGNGIFAGDGGWEYPLLMGLTAIYFVVHGGGPISVDAAIEHRLAEGGVPPVHGLEAGGPMPGPA